ncbi:hypothetical protein BJF71_07500 [Helicobacter pylori]|uniref:hypothetical protein n=1 Tax=Helicobacter pylori TaxID=210 RepID=UPI0009526D61|nr:hypothetical protein [Helicobacter pylori]OLQ25729.1 hypothetical protein BJF71_07500 [Helicobacter pylori]
MFKKKKKKKGFWGVLELFFNIKRGLKSGLIGIAVKMEIHLLGGIVLDLVVKLKGGFWNNIPTNPLITLKKSPPKSSFFSFCE